MSDSDGRHAEDKSTGVVHRLVRRNKVYVIDVDVVPYRPLGRGRNSCETETNLRYTYDLSREPLSGDHSGLLPHHSRHSDRLPEVCT